MSSGSRIALLAAGAALPLLATVMAPNGAAAPVPAAAAAPAGYAVLVKPTKNLAGRSSVKVKITGLPRTVGVYVRLCATTGSRPAAEQCLGSDARSGRWVIQKYPYGKRPSTSVNPKKGWFRLPVKQRFGAVNCGAQPCAINVRRDHQGGGDFSYDRNIRVRF